MKILKLLEIIQVSNDHKTSTNQFKDDRSNERRMNRVTNTKDKKTGFYGRVYDKEQPHTLTKANYVSEMPQNDPYLIYIKHIADNNLAAENPFVPRVYEVRTVEDVRGKVKYKIEIERLQRMEEIEPEVVSGIVTTLFDDNQIDTFYDKLTNNPNNTLAKGIELVCRGKIESKDPLLNSAGALINNIRKSNTRFDFDIHKGNIMVRLSPSPQVVIVDPLAQEGTGGEFM